MSDPKPAPIIEFAEGGKTRFKAVPLECPLKVDGKVLKIVTVRRLKAAEVSEMQDSFVSGGIAMDKMMLHFVDQPAEVIGHLDQDDYAEVMSTVMDFLPERLRQELENAAETAAQEIMEKSETGEA